MAIRLIKNIYYVYFRGIDGRLCTRSLKTSNKKEAERRGNAVMRAVRAQKSRFEIENIVPQAVTRARVIANTVRDFSNPPLDTEKTPAIQNTTPAPARNDSAPQQKEADTISGQDILDYFGKPMAARARQNSNRLKLCDVLDIVSKRRRITSEHIAVFEKFVKYTKLKYVDEATPKIALDFLNHFYSGGNGKTFNNNRGRLNVIFKNILVDAEMIRSPFELIAPMLVESIDHYRPFSVEEFIRIFKTVKEPWKTMALISWHTGLRLEGCWRLSWAHIDVPTQIATIMPGKTARFKRAVNIPLHDELWAWINSLPKPKNPTDHIVSIFGKDYNHKAHDFRNTLDALEIFKDADGKVGFHSIRSSFITRCDEGGIDRRATRGIVGHVSDEMTDLYSHDIETAKQVLKLPSLGIFNKRE